MTYNAKYNSTDAKEELRNLIDYYCTKDKSSIEAIKDFVNFLDHPDFLGYKNNSDYPLSDSFFETRLKEFNNKMKMSFLKVLKEQDLYGCDLFYWAISNLLWQVHNYRPFPISSFHNPLEALFDHYVEFSKKYLLPFDNLETFNESQ